MAHILDVIAHMQSIIAGQSATIFTVLSVLFVIAKSISTSKAPVVVAQIQGAFDSVAKALIGFGNVLQAVANALSQVLASDGVLGKK